MARARGGGGAEREGCRRGSGRGGGTGRARGRDAARRQRLQGANVRGAGEAGDPGGRRVLRKKPHHVDPTRSIGGDRRDCAGDWSGGTATRGGNGRAVAAASAFVWRYFF